MPRNSQATVPSTSSTRTNGAEIRPCPCVAERRERVRREALAFDVFRNSTEHEEYQPS